MEIEIKLALDVGAAKRLRRHPVLATVARKTQRLFSVYFDTPAFDLLRAGVALRLRRVGASWWQTVKARADHGGMLSERPEWEVKLASNRPDLDVLPAEARRLIPAAADLTPAFETEFRRTTWTLKEGDSCIEVALDRGEIRAAGRTLPISELELELQAGDLGDLFALGERFVADLPVQLEPRSKAQRGYQLAGALPLCPVKAAIPQLNADTPASAAYAAIVRACMGHFEANLPGYLAAVEPDPDPEYVHQMRVAMRRLRAVTGLTRFLQRQPPIWLEELRWLMRELAEARDWDVLVTETLPRVRTHLERPAQLDALTEVAQRLRLQANERARAALASTRLARLWLAIERDLAATPGTAISTAAWARAALDRRYRQVHRLGSRLDELDPAERHALRIAGKKLRYAAECFAGLRPKAARRFIATLAKVQDALGVLNDMAVTAHLLEQAKQVGNQAVWEGAGLTTGVLVREQELGLATLARVWREFRHARPYWR